MLKSEAVLKPIKTPEDKNVTSKNVINKSSIIGATYDFNLPADYLHLLNCICIFFVKRKFKCYDAGTYWE